MRTNYIFVCGFILTLVLAQAAQATQPPAIAGVYLQYSLNHERNGVYDLIMKEALVRSGFNTGYFIEPMGRAIQSFKAGAADCLFPVSQRFLDNVIQGSERKDILISLPFHKAMFVAYYYDKAIAKDLIASASSNTWVVGLPQTMDSDNILSYFGLSYDVQVIQGQDISMLLRQLQRGRSNVMVYTYPLPLLVADRLGIPQPYADLDRPVLIDEYSIACHSSAASKKFISRMNSALVSLWKDGTIERILGKNYPSNVLLPDVLAGQLN